MEIYGYKTIMEDSAKPATPHEMVLNLLTANTEVLHVLSTVFDIATEEKQQGLANLVADRMGIHKKFEWQLQATLKDIGVQA